MTRLQHREQGLSLIELMVSLTIGLVLVAAATKIYVDSHAAYAISEQNARLEENARYAMNMIESDLRMAGNLGFASVVSGNLLTGVASQSMASAGGPDACGNNFARDLNTPIQASNTGYPFPGGCPAYNNRPVLTADVLTIRRASGQPKLVPDPTRLQVCSNFSNYNVQPTIGTPCNGPTQQLNDLIVHNYYISRDAQGSGGPILNTPALRRRSLDGTAGGPSFTDAAADQEILPGVEDMQIQLGIRTPAGAPTAATTFQYIDPPNLAGLITTVPAGNLSPNLPAGSDVISVRIWLLVRADTPEVGFIDQNTYEYGARSLIGGTTFDLNNAGQSTLAYRPSLSGSTALTDPKRYRRLLVSRTIQIRNSQ